MKQITLKVDGMMCGMCEAHVNDRVRNVKGVITVKSSHVKKETVAVIKDDTDVNEIKSAIEKDGYKVLSVGEPINVKKTLFGYKEVK